MSASEQATSWLRRLLAEALQQEYCYIEIVPWRLSVEVRMRKGPNRRVMVSSNSTLVTEGEVFAAIPIILGVIPQGQRFIGEIESPDGRRPVRARFWPHRQGITLIVQPKSPALQ